MKNGLTVEIKPQHMYCNEAIISDKEGSVSATVEYGVDGRLLIWELDFECDEARRRRLLAALVSFLDSKNIGSEIFWGKHRMTPKLP